MADCGIRPKIKDQRPKKCMIAWMHECINEQSAKRVAQSAGYRKLESGVRKRWVNG
jgi:hypothetical protein